MSVEGHGPRRRPSGSSRRSRSVTKRGLTVPTSPSGPLYDKAGRLHIDGQDLGPVTKSVSGDGEYEYFKMVAKEEIPRLIELLGGKPEDDMLGLLRRNWTCDRSYDLERS